MIKSPKVVAGLVYPGCLSLDLIGPMEAFNYAALSTLKSPTYQLITLGETTNPVDTLSGIKIVADHTLEDYAAPIDTLLVPGMRTGDMSYLDSQIVPWLKARAPNIRRVASVCSGVLILGAAGLLDGRSVTTHWMDSKDLSTLYPEANVVDDQIYIKDGPIYSSGGVTAGIDLALAMIEEDLGHGAALSVAKRMIVVLKRAGNQTQFSDLLVAQEKAHKFSSLINWLEININQALTVEQMASQCAMSRRNFARAFAQELGSTPIQYLKRRRQERAKHLLETTDYPLAQIALESGLKDTENLRRTFVAQFGISPKHYRDRFGAKSESFKRV